MIWSTYLLQIILLLLLFTACITIPLSRDPTAFAGSYPPDIQEVYYKTQGLRRPEWGFQKAELIRKGLGLLAAMFPLCWMAHAAGARSFAGALGILASYLLVIAAFDTFILDWIFFPRIRRWRLPGTEHMDRY